MLSGENNEKLDIQREVLSSFLISSTQKFAYLKKYTFPLCHEKMGFNNYFNRRIQCKIPDNPIQDKKHNLEQFSLIKE